MKAKRITVILALAVGGVLASRERGYCPVVGYQNVAITNGYNFVGNPLDNPPNTLSNVFSGSPVPNGTAAYLWDVPSQAFLSPSVFSSLTHRWSLNYDVSPGNGFVIVAGAAWTATFVGEVLEGTNTISVAGNGKWSLLAGKVPIAGALLSTTNVPPFPAVDGDSVFIFDSASQSYPAQPATFLGGFGWYNPAQPGNTDGPVVAVAQPFFIRNMGPGDTNWVQLFNASPGPSPASGLAAQVSASPDIRRISIAAGRVTLEVVNPDGGPYSVQFSSNGRSWTTVAASQTGATWTGPPPEGTQGYYQVVQP